MGNTYTTTTNSCTSDESTPKSSHFERVRCEKCNRSECFARVIAAQNASRHKSYANFCVPGTIYFRPQLGPNIYTKSTPLLSSNGLIPYDPTNKTPRGYEKFNPFSPAYNNDEPLRNSKGNDYDRPSSQDNDAQGVPHRSPGILKDENRNNIQRKSTDESSPEKPLQIQNETSRPNKSEDGAPEHERPTEDLGGGLPGPRVSDTNDGSGNYGNSGPSDQPLSSSPDYPGDAGSANDQNYGHGGGFDPTADQPTPSKPFTGALTDPKPRSDDNRRSKNSVPGKSPVIHGVPSGLADRPNKGVFTGTNSTQGPRTGTSNQEINAVGPQRPMSNNKAHSKGHSIPNFEANGPDSSPRDPQASAADYGTPVLESEVGEELPYRNKRQNEGEKIDNNQPPAPAPHAGSSVRPNSSADSNGDPKARAPSTNGPVPAGTNSPSTSPHKTTSQGSPDSTDLYPRSQPQNISIPNESGGINGVPDFDKAVGGNVTPGQSQRGTTDLRPHSNSQSEPGSSGPIIISGPHGTNGAVEAIPRQSDAQTGGGLEFKKQQGSRSGESNYADFGANMPSPSTQDDHVPSIGVAKGNIVPEGDRMRQQNAGVPAMNRPSSIGNSTGGKSTPGGSVFNSGAPTGTRTVTGDDDLQPSLSDSDTRGLPYTGTGDPVQNGRVRPDEPASFTKPPSHVGDDEYSGQREPNLNSAGRQAGNDPTRKRTDSGTPEQTPQRKLQRPPGANRTGGRDPEGSTRQEIERSPESRSPGSITDGLLHPTELSGGPGSNGEPPVVAKGFPTNGIKAPEKAQNTGAEVTGNQLSGLNPSGGTKKDSGAASDAPSTGVTGPGQGTKRDKGVPDDTESIPLRATPDSLTQRSHTDPNGYPHSDSGRPPSKEDRPSYGRLEPGAALPHPGKDTLVPSVGGKDGGRDSSSSGPTLRADKGTEARVSEDSDGGNNLSSEPVGESDHSKLQTSVQRSSAGPSLEPLEYSPQQHPLDVSKHKAEPVNPAGTGQDVSHAPVNDPYASGGLRPEERKSLDDKDYVPDNVPPSAKTSVGVQQPKRNHDGSSTGTPVPTRAQGIQKDDYKAPILSSAVGYPDSFDHNRTPHYEDVPTSTTPRTTVDKNETTPMPAGKLTELGRERDEVNTPSGNIDSVTSPNEPANVSQAIQAATDPNLSSSVPNHNSYPTSVPVPLATTEPIRSRDSGTNPGIPPQVVPNPAYPKDGDEINPSLSSPLQNATNSEPGFHGSVHLPKTDHRLGPSYIESQNKADGAKLDNLGESTGDDYSYQQRPSKDGEPKQKPSYDATTTGKTDRDAATNPISDAGSQSGVPSEKSGSPLTDQNDAKSNPPTQTATGGKPSHSKQRKPADRFSIPPRPVTYGGRPFSSTNEQPQSRPVTQPKSFAGVPKKKTGQSTGNHRRAGCSPYSMPLNLPQRLSKKALGSACCIKDPCLVKLDNLVANNNCRRQNKQRNCILPPSGIKLADFVKDIDTVNDRRSKRSCKQPARRIKSDAEMMNCLVERKQERPLSRPEVPSAFTVIYPSTSGQCPPGTVRRKDGFFAVPKRGKGKSQDAWYQNQDDSYNRAFLSNGFEGSNRKGLKASSRVDSSQIIPFHAPGIPQNNGKRLNASSLDHLRDIQFTDLPAGLKDSIKKLQNDYDQYILVCNKVASELKDSARQSRLHLFQPEPVRIVCPSNRISTESRQTGSAILFCPDPDPCNMLNTCAPCRMQMCPCPCAVCPPPQCVPAYCICSAENVQLDDNSAVVSAQNSSTKANEKQDMIVEDSMSNTELALQQALGPKANSDGLLSVSCSNALNEQSTNELNAWMDRLRKKLATGMEFQSRPREKLSSASSNAVSTCDARNPNHVKNSMRMPLPSAFEARAQKNENIFDVLQNIDNALQSPEGSIQVSSTDVTASPDLTFASNIELNSDVESHESVKLPFTEDKSAESSVVPSTCATPVLRATLKTKESHTKPVRVRFSNPVVKDCWTMSPRAEMDNGQRLEITVDRNQNYRLEDGQKSKRRQRQ